MNLTPFNLTPTKLFVFVSPHQWLLFENTWCEITISYDFVSETCNGEQGDAVGQLNVMPLGLRNQRFGNNFELHSGILLMLHYLRLAILF